MALFRMLLRQCRRSSSFISRSFARVRFRRVLRRSWKPAPPGAPAIVCEAQEVEGFRRLAARAACRRWAANRPNSISRVLSACKRQRELLPAVP